MAPRPRVQHHAPEPPASTVIRVYRHTLGVTGGAR